jgi:hypothetical protein
VPNVIRKNRNSIALLTGEETARTYLTWGTIFLIIMDWAAAMYQTAGTGRVCFQFLF